VCPIGAELQKLFAANEPLKRNAQATNIPDDHSTHEYTAVERLVKAVRMIEVHGIAIKETN